MNFNSQKNCFWGTSSPRPSISQVSVFRKITILIISIIKQGFYVNVGMLSNEFSCLFEMFAQNMHQKGLVSDYFISQKKLQLLGDQVLYCSKM